MSVAVALLDTMWDWEARKRLYDWLGHFDLLCTNSCKELVTGPNQRGNPDKEWVKANLAELWPFELLLVCGRVAQATYELASAPHPCRVIECPHPAARQWDRKSLAFMKRLVREGKQSITCEMRRGQLMAFPLIPF